MAANGALGWQGELGDFSITASAGIDYAWVDLDPFTESGAFPFNASYRNLDGESLQSALNFRIRRPFVVAGKTVIPEARAGWQHEFLDQNNVTSANFAAGLGTPFKVVTTAGSKDLATAGAGATMFLTEALSMTVNYDARLASDFTSHDVTLLMRFAW